MTDLPDYVIRKKDLPQYMGLSRSRVDELIRDGVIQMFAPAEGGRAKVAFAKDVADWQRSRRDAAVRIVAEPTPPKPIRVKRRHLKKS